MAGDGEQVALARAPRVLTRVVGGESPLDEDEARRWLEPAPEMGSAIAGLCDRYGGEPGVSLWLRYGRCALGVALDLCGVGPTDCVALASYQCGAVVKKIIQRTRHTLAYPLDEQLQPLVEEFTEMSRRAHAVITCVYYGSRSGGRRLETLAAQVLALPNRPWVIEDRVMCAPDPDGVRAAARRCDITVLSFRKHYPVPDGALLVAHSARARRQLRAIEPRVAVRGTVVQDEAIRQKVLAKRGRGIWRSSPNMVDDPVVNALAESVASEVLVDQVADSREADYVSGSAASAAFLERANLDRDADRVEALSNLLVARLSARGTDVALPLTDCRGLGVPMLVSDPAGVRRRLMPWGVFLPSHWPAGGLLPACPTARSWHRHELTMPISSRMSDDDAEYLAKVVGQNGNEGDRESH